MYIHQMSDEQKLPRAFRPYRAMILAIAPMLETDEYTRMSEAEFVAALTKRMNGSISPTAASELYKKLINEAGL